MHRFWTFALAAAVTHVACQTGRAQGPSVYSSEGSAYQGGSQVTMDYPQGGSPVSPGTGPVSYSGDYSGVGGPVGLGSGGYDQLYPYDDPQPWIHGYWQDIPSYGGWRYFRPYNYKHALSQSQVAAGWGMSPTMPYSQELFRRYPPVSPTPLTRMYQAPASPLPVAQTYEAPVPQMPVTRSFEAPQTSVESLPEAAPAAPVAQSRKASYDEQIYRAELARLRAQRDFDRMQGTVPTADKPESAANVPVRLPAPNAAAAHDELTPTKYTRTVPAQAQLQEKIRQQQRELQDLQDALRREAERR